MCLCVISSYEGITSAVCHIFYSDEKKLVAFILELRAWFYQALTLVVWMNLANVDDKAVNICAIGFIECTCPNLDFYRTILS